MVALRRSRPIVDPGITRRRVGRGFRYVDEHGRRVTDPTLIARARSLVIPPAWREVWIARDPRGHIQAAGRDQRGRLQYIYHPRWRAQRAAAKYRRLAAFVEALPRLRRQVARDVACRCVCRESVSAAVIALLERGHLRIGSDEYARDNDTYGATTLERRHLRLRGKAIDLSFRGKSGVVQKVHVEDPVLARVVRHLRTLPGQRLFQYRDGRGAHAITATDVNRYLHDALGARFTAKDFRTWAATITCALLLGREPAPRSVRAGRRVVRQAIGEVAERLGHTPTVCRTSYVHPRVIESYLAGELGAVFPSHLRERVAAGCGVRDLRAAERHLLRLLG